MKLTGKNLFFIGLLVLSQVNIDARHGGGFGGGFATGALVGTALTLPAVAAASSDRSYFRNLEEENYYLRSQFDQMRMENMRLQQQIDELKRTQ